MKLVKREEPKKFDKALRIKYDKLDQRVGLLVAVVGMTGWILALFLMDMKLTDGMDIIPETVVVLGGCVFCPFVSIVGWRLFFSSWGYLRRLRKYGYKVPDYKKKYGRRLDRLERLEIPLLNERKYHKESMCLAWISWLAGVFSIPYPIYVCKLYPDMEVVMEMMLAVVVCWILLGAYYWRQRNLAKFKDDVELDDNRKIRQNLVDGLITIMVCVCLCILYFAIMQKMADVIYRVRVEAGWYD